MREDSQMRQQARVQDEADPFARLHPGRRLFLPSLSPEGADCTNGQSSLHVCLTFPLHAWQEGSRVLWLRLHVVGPRSSKGLDCSAQGGVPDEQDPMRD